MFVSGKHCNAPGRLYEGSFCNAPGCLGEVAFAICLVRRIVGRKNLLLTFACGVYILNSVESIKSAFSLCLCACGGTGNVLRRSTPARLQLAAVVFS